MRRPRSARIALALAALAPILAPDVGAAQIGSPVPLQEGIEAVGWMAGCWERRTATTLTEEQWMAPAGGTMLGMSRTVRGDRTVAHEALWIEERDGRLVYVASPSGQATTEFAATVVADTLVAFENPDHDFPQRILYRPAAGDSLHARVEGVREGRVRGADFRYERVACPGAASPADAYTNTTGVRER